MNLDNIKYFINNTIETLEKEKSTEYLEGMLASLKAVKRVVDFQDSLEQVLG